MIDSEIMKPCLTKHNIILNPNFKSNTNSLSVEWLMAVKLTNGYISEVANSSGN